MDPFPIHFASNPPNNITSSPSTHNSTMSKDKSVVMPLDIDDEQEREYQKNLNVSKTNQNPLNPSNPNRITLPSHNNNTNTHNPNLYTINNPTLNPHQNPSDNNNISLNEDQYSQSFQLLAYHLNLLHANFVAMSGSLEMVCRHLNGVTKKEHKDKGVGKENENEKGDFPNNLNFPPLYSNLFPQPYPYFINKPNTNTNPNLNPYINNKEKEKDPRSFTNNFPDDDYYSNTNNLYSHNGDEEGNVNNDEGDSTPYPHLINQETINYLPLNNNHNSYTPPSTSPPRVRSSSRVDSTINNLNQIPSIPIPAPIPSPSPTHTASTVSLPIGSGSTSGGDLIIPHANQTTLVNVSGPTPQSSFSANSSSSSSPSHSPSEGTSHAQIEKIINRRSTTSIPSNSRLLNFKPSSATAQINIINNSPNHNTIPNSKSFDSINHTQSNVPTNAIISTESTQKSSNNLDNLKSNTAIEDDDDDVTQAQLHIHAEQETSHTNQINNLPVPTQPNSILSTTNKDNDVNHKSASVAKVTSNEKPPESMNKSNNTTIRRFSMSDFSAIQQSLNNSNNINSNETSSKEPTITHSSSISSVNSSMNNPSKSTIFPSTVSISSLIHSPGNKRSSMPILSALQQPNISQILAASAGVNNNPNPYPSPVSRPRGLSVPSANNTNSIGVNSVSSNMFSIPNSPPLRSWSINGPLNGGQQFLDDGCASPVCLSPRASHSTANTTTNSGANGSDSWSLLGSNNKVRLNVGGQLFYTSISTLTRQHPNGSSSGQNLFSSMFSGQWTPDLDDRGAYFIDRDPTYFRHILNYLRDGSFSLIGMSNVAKLALLRESKYYGISGLVALLSNDVARSKMLMRRELSQEKEYKLMLNISEKDLANTLTKMTMSEGYDVENWMRAEKEKKSVHLLLSKKLSRGELMLLDRLQTHM